MIPFLLKEVDVNSFYCNICELVKHTRVFSLYCAKSNSVLGGFISFTDDGTKVSWIFLLKYKSDVVKSSPTFII